jgi:hypothetical protein
VSDCNRFSIRPLKWLRFLGYAIYGCDGHIHARIDGRPVNYNLAVRGGAEYYFISSGTRFHIGVECLLIFNKMILNFWTLIASMTGPRMPVARKPVTDFALLWKRVMLPVLLRINLLGFV